MSDRESANVEALSLLGADAVTDAAIEEGCDSTKSKKRPRVEIDTPRTLARRDGLPTPAPMSIGISWPSHKDTTPDHLKKPVFISKNTSTAHGDATGGAAAADQPATPQPKSKAPRWSNVEPKAKASKQTSVRLCCIEPDDGEETSPASVGNPISMSELTKQKFEKDKTVAATKPPTSSTTLSSRANYKAVKIIDDDIVTPKLLVAPPLQIVSDAWELQGRRPYMEDAFSISTQDNFEFFGVYDGHGGSRASDMAATSLHGMIADSLHSKDLQAVKSGVRKCFLDLDERFLKIANRDHLRDGCTALVALVLEQQLVVGWVGDTRAVLCRCGRAVRASEDHKPNRPDEQKRVEESGGSVGFNGVWRVLGPTALAVSRAIGDRAMKHPNPLVIADPEFRQFSLSHEDEFLVIATDGLWDVLKEQDTVDLVLKYVEEFGGYKGVAKHIVERALALGSMDNITAVVVGLKWTKTPAEQRPNGDDGGGGGGGGDGGGGGGANGGGGAATAQSLDSSRSVTPTL